MTSLWTRAGMTWRQFGAVLLRQIWEDEVLGRCAELAYVFLFSVFPMLLFLTTLLGYLAEANPGLRWILFTYIARISPSGDVTALLNNTLAEIAAARTGTKLYLSLIAAVWVASNGMIAVSRTLNTACGLKETRRWWKRRLIAIVLTLTFSVLIICALGLIFYGTTIGEAVAERLGIGWVFAMVWHFFQWPLVLVFVLISFEMVYNYAPNLGSSPNRQWGTPGAVTAVALWLLASFGLRAYLSYRHAFTTAYGSLGAVILLLVWFYLTAFAILMGGEVNSEIARELARQRGEQMPPRPTRRRREMLLRRWRKRQASRQERSS
ncbi:MAG TPA: YihY/virulence factor BrkB family protein [Thermoanaerobaculia bacterium]|jgi:membrane protein|nr:YihY/virulence factor BrkB family protein [Thermoanaerobaculia bacterium]